jgi:hypothetical protein
LHPEARRVLVVGVGAGQTPARFLLHPIERLDAVDIEPAVFDLIRPHFASAWMDDPRVRLLREDGRSYVAHGAGRYDVISLEVGQVFHPGAASFYTADFYRRARERLEPGGMLCQFMPLPFFSVDSFRAALATFLASFPSSMLWYNTSELLLIGVDGDGYGEISTSRLEATLAAPAVRDDLGFSYWGGPAYWLRDPDVFLAGFLAGPAGLARVAAGAPILTDDRPVLDYASTDVRDTDVNELPIVDLLRAHLDPPAALLKGPLDPRRSAEIVRVRARNLDDVAASALARRAEALQSTAAPGQLAAMLAEAASRNPENVRIQRLLGDALALAGRPDDAQASYERALTLDPGNAHVHRGLGALLHRRGRVDEAARHYEAALAIDPDDAEAHNNLGAAVATRGDHVSALRHFERAVALQPGYADARRNLERLRAHLARTGAR